MEPDGTRVISKDTHHQNIDFNIYEGMECTGIPAITLSRGTVVWENGELKTTRGAGKHIDRAPFAPYFEALAKHNKLHAPTGVER